MLEEVQERHGSEDLGELVNEPRSLLDGDGTEDMGRLAHAEGVDARLLSNRRPGPVKAPVEPEARFVLERYDAAAAGRFFLIWGNVSRSQTA
jgi:hypothetical protein